MTPATLRRWTARTALALAVAAFAPAAGAHHQKAGDGVSEQRAQGLLHPRDASAALESHDAATAGIVSSGPFAHVTKNLAVASHGERLVPNATTDVWALGRYAYIGTFNTPCGSGEGFGEPRLVQDRTKPGIPVFDVHNRNRARYVGNVPSVEGSRINDVKVARMNSGTILVHSNESCAGGPGGFEIYDVSNPLRPVHLAHAQTDDVNAVNREVLGAVDVGVHNLFLFRQGEKDYVAANAEGFFGNFQIFEITDPTNPTLVGSWGAEELCAEAFCSADPANETDLDIVLDTIVRFMFDGFGSSRNRFLHDMTISADGTKAYLSNWDAGLVLLDISDPSDPQFISTALDPENGSLDGEVNSHAAWPTEDGSVVVETEEDFDTPFSVPNITFGTAATNTIPGVATSTVAGDAFEGSETGNVVTVTRSSITVESGPLAGRTFPAREGGGNQPRLSTLGGSITGEAVWIGRACDGDPIENAGALGPGVQVAIARRGACTFREKLKNAAAAGADAIVIANNDRSVWGGVRIWDYSDPENPVLASTFNTVCSADPNHPSCDRRGTYTVHNVIVERDKAYLSWYSDGVLILDISDPYHPKEVARWHREGRAFEAMNGGIQDVWGIYKERNRPWLYASDRNGGLYVLKEYGAGSAKRGKR